MLYSRVRPVGAIAPFAVAGKQSTQVVYEYQGLPSYTITVPVAATHPGVFPLGTVPIVRKGDTLVLYATGAGATDRAVADGQITDGPPFPRLLAPVTVTVGGVSCPVLYAGYAPALIAGMVQINVQITADVPGGYARQYACLCLPAKPRRILQDPRALRRCSHAEDARVRIR